LVGQALYGLLIQKSKSNKELDENRDNLQVMKKNNDVLINKESSENDQVTEDALLCNTVLKSFFKILMLEHHLHYPQTQQNIQVSQ
jgi:hypothetical protein